AESSAPQRHGRSDLAVFLAAGALLADLGLLRVQGHDRGLARHTGSRLVLCRTAILALELSRTVAGGRGRRSVFHGGADRAPARLAPQTYLGPGGPRSRSRGAQPAWPQRRQSD